MVKAHKCTICHTLKTLCLTIPEKHVQVILKKHLLLSGEHHRNVIFSPLHVIFCFLEISSFMSVTHSFKSNKLSEELLLSATLRKKTKFCCYLNPFFFIFFCVCIIIGILMCCLYLGIFSWNTVHTKCAVCAESCKSRKWEQKVIVLVVKYQWCWGPQLLGGRSESLGGWDVELF